MKKLIKLFFLLIFISLFNLDCTKEVSKNPDEGRHTITFDTKGGSAVGSVKIRHNTVLNNRTTTKEGYDFKEWRLDGKAYDFSKKVTENFNLVATWVSTITFKTESISTIEPCKVVYGDTLIRPINPTKYGYIFKDWHYKGESYNFSTPVFENMELLAVWEEGKEISTDFSKETE